MVCRSAPGRRKKSGKLSWFLANKIVLQKSMIALRFVAKILTSIVILNVTSEDDNIPTLFLKPRLMSSSCCFVLGVKTNIKNCQNLAYKKIR